jgi:hypothetical protein
MTFEDPAHVQWFLDNLEPMEQFAVIFQKQDGTQRVLIGNLDPNGQSRKESVPMQTDEGWKSFSVNRVLWIGYPDQCEMLKERLAQ